MAAPKTKSTGKRKISTEFLLLFYDAHLRERDLTVVAAMLDISKPTLMKWTANYPELQLAKRIAEEKKAKASTLGDYVYKSLSPEARAAWDEIQFWDDSRGSADRINDILSGKTVRLKQELYIHALISRGFNASEACRLSGVSRDSLDKWKINDPHFLQLVEEIEWHKCNFYESALVDLVGEGNPAAVIFANRTKNAHRGYNEKLVIEHGGSIGLSFNVEELNLSIECRKELLGAIRERKRSIERADENKKAIDVTSSVSS